MPSPQGSQEFYPREQLGKVFGRHQVLLTEWKGPVVFKLNEDSLVLWGFQGDAVQPE